ncbi:hypothetical protein N7527_002440 [Penicillium freii]|nr:hypothetical protein N7527_002440 [Penicillium freii]
MTVPVSTLEPIPEQSNCISSNLSVVEPSDISDSRDYKNNSEPSKNLYLRANKASKRAKDPSTIEDTLAISWPSSPPTACSILKCSRARIILSSKPPKQEATRISIRAAAAVYKKRLRLGRGTGDH